MDLPEAIKPESYEEDFWYYDLKFEIGNVFCIQRMAILIHVVRKERRKNNKNRTQKNNCCLAV